MTNLFEAATTEEVKRRIAQLRSLEERYSRRLQKPRRWRLLRRHGVGGGTEVPATKADWVLFGRLANR